MKEIKRIDRYEEVLEEGIFCYYTDHKAVVETMQKRIEELEGERESLKVNKLMLLRESVNDGIKIKELKEDIKEYYNAETLNLITKFDN